MAGFLLNLGELAYRKEERIMIMPLSGLWSLASSKNLARSVLLSLAGQTVLSCTDMRLSCGNLLCPEFRRAITLAELSAGPHEVRRNDEQNAYDEHAERARRLDILPRAGNEFDPVPFDAEAARMFGRVTAQSSRQAASREAGLPP